jgi:hypothetical protein
MQMLFYFLRMDDDQHKHNACLANYLLGMNENQSSTSKQLHKQYTLSLQSKRKAKEKKKKTLKEKRKLHTQKKKLKNNAPKSRQRGL